MRSYVSFLHFSGFLGLRLMDDAGIAVSVVAVE
jgi:hypothetical protein